MWAGACVLGRYFEEGIHCCFGCGEPASAIRATAVLEGLSEDARVVLTTAARLFEETSQLQADLNNDQHPKWQLYSSPVGHHLKNYLESTARYLQTQQDEASKRLPEGEHDQDLDNMGVLTLIDPIAEIGVPYPNPTSTFVKCPGRDSDGLMVINQTQKTISFLNITTGKTEDMEAPIEYFGNKWTRCSPDGTLIFAGDEVRFSVFSLTTRTRLGGGGCGYLAHSFSLPFVMGSSLREQKSEEMFSSDSRKVAAAFSISLPSDRTQWTIRVWKVQKHAKGGLTKEGWLLYGGQRRPGWLSGIWTPQRSSWTAVLIISADLRKSGMALELCPVQLEDPTLSCCAPITGVQRYGVPPHLGSYARSGAIPGTILSCPQMVDFSLEVHFLPASLSVKAGKMRLPVMSGLYFATQEMLRKTK
ncbi:hypothetical protein QBC35DRAFT_99735 [Podospora australis]|uniref:Uncharacterized protein n=1 Tax=Podospora australis TaxID=1536484 RepID=A0AAN6X4I4_9PEZI|nr:hypothetical protein QBC35DRAFT_99735 [Podospora australis]